MSNPFLNLSLSHPLPRPLYLNSHSILIPAFVLTDEQHMLLCPKDVREGKVIDRYLAPAILIFAIDIRTEVKCQPTLDRPRGVSRRRHQGESSWERYQNAGIHTNRPTQKSHMGKRFHC
jgi:hypothetical protein